MGWKESIDKWRNEREFARQERIQEKAQRVAKREKETSELREDRIREAKERTERLKKKTEGYVSYRKAIEEEKEAKRELRKQKYGRAIAFAEKVQSKVEAYNKGRAEKRKELKKGIARVETQFGARTKVTRKGRRGKEISYTVPTSARKSVEYVDSPMSRMFNLGYESDINRGFDTGRPVRNNILPSFSAPKKRRKEKSMFSSSGMFRF